MNRISNVARFEGPTLVGLACLLLWSVSASLGAQEVPTSEMATPKPLATALRAAQQAGVQVAFMAEPLDGGTPLLAHQVSRPLNPASVMKLVTTYSAFGTLGPNFRWKTGAYLTAPIVDGVVQGNLVLRGGNDPKLVIEDLTEWMARWRKAGLREIRGDLVIDDAMYEAPGPAMDPFDGDPAQPYNVRPFPLLMNFKAAKFVVQPRAEEHKVAISLDPPLADVVIEDRVQLNQGPCGAGADGLVVQDIKAQPPTVRLSGPYSTQCGEQGAYSAVLDHRQFIQSIVKAAWQAQGGQWAGQARIERGASAKLPLWQEWISPRPLFEVVRDINKFSNNVMARHLILQMGYETAHQPATVDRGKQAVVAYLRSQGLNLPDLVIDNGSGLSRQERISARSLIRVLLKASSFAHAQLFQDSLPVVGQDGTMKKRLLGQPIVGNAWIKTGSLNAVSAIAGYVTAQSGRRYAVAFLANGPGASASKSAQDTFLRWVYEKG